MKKFALLTLALTSLFAVSAHADVTINVYDADPLRGARHEVNTRFWDGRDSVVVSCAAMPEHHTHKWYVASGHSHQRMTLQTSAFRECIQHHKHCVNLGCEVNEF